MIGCERYAVTTRLSTSINHTLTSSNIFYNVRKRRTSAHHFDSDMTLVTKTSHAGPNSN
jgi:hypothetical protein